MLFTTHQFRPGETIDAVLRWKGRHNFTQAELAVLRQKFYELNGNGVIKAGQTLKIPLEEKDVKIL